MDRHRSVVIAAPRVGRIERQVRRQLIIHGKLTTVDVRNAPFASTPALRGKRR